MRARDAFLAQVDGLMVDDPADLGLFASVLGGRLMRTGGGGSIINTTSIAGLSGDAGPLAYSAAKAAVINMSMGAAVELASDRIRVNAICPGFIETPILSSIPDKVIKMMEEKVPLRRLGKPEDFEGIGAYLCSDASSFISGETIYIDGGYKCRP